MTGETVNWSPWRRINAIASQSVATRQQRVAPNSGNHLPVKLPSETKSKKERKTKGLNNKGTKVKQNKTKL